MLNGYYAPLLGCDQRINAYCASECTAFGTVVARFDGGDADEGPEAEWRCYGLGSLSADKRSYSTGDEYCTRDRADQIRALLGVCTPPPPPSPPSPPPPPVPAPPPEPYMLNGYYTPASGCDEALNAYCASSCKVFGTVVARLDGGDGTGVHGGTKWRCDAEPRAVQRSQGIRCTVHHSGCCNVRATGAMTLTP